MRGLAAPCRCDSWTSADRHTRPCMAPTRGERRTAQGVELIWPGRRGWCTRSMFLFAAGTRRLHSCRGRSQHGSRGLRTSARRGRIEEDLFRGFPCVTGTIAGTGPRAWMGWVQVIERRDVKGTVTIDVDTAPVFATGSPLYAFGYLPTFSDFPATRITPTVTGWRRHFSSPSPTWSGRRYWCRWRHFTGATGCGTTVRSSCSRQSSSSSRLGMLVGTCSGVGTRIGRSSRPGTPI